MQFGYVRPCRHTVKTRRCVVAAITAISLASGFIVPANAGVLMTGRAGNTTAAGDRSEDANLDTIEEALTWLGDASPEEIRRAFENRNAFGEDRGVLLPGPTAIVGCVLNAAWVFRDGYDADRIYYQLADLVMGCAGIPFASGLTTKVAKLIWKNRQRIAAALGVVGITAAQLAPFLNAPEPE